METPNFGLNKTTSLPNFKRYINERAEVAYKEKE